MTTGWWVLASSARDVLDGFFEALLPVVSRHGPSGLELSGPRLAPDDIGHILAQPQNRGSDPPRGGLIGDPPTRRVPDDIEHIWGKVVGWLTTAPL